MTNREKQFLEELGKLTKKYNIEIRGCGCCGSPYLEDLTGEVKYMSEKIGYNKKTGKYEEDLARA